jgi:hypothetical protein
MEDIRQNIVTLVRKKMREAGAYDREAYRQYVEESIEYYLERGEISEEENLELLEEELLEMYSDTEDKLAD